MDNFRFSLFNQLCVASGLALIAISAFCWGTLIYAEQMLGIGIGIAIMSLHYMLHIVLDVPSRVTNCLAAAMISISEFIALIFMRTIAAFVLINVSNAMLITFMTHSALLILSSLD